MVGRFQPLTDGHLRCVNEAWSQFKVPTIICLIDTPEEKIDEKHPFSSNILLPIYNELSDNAYYHIEKVILVKNADIVKNAEILHDLGYEIQSWTCGTDRIKAYTAMADRYKEQAELSDDFKMIEVKRSDDDISATRVRKALLDGDIRTFNALTPYETLKNSLHSPNKVYNILRSEILKLYK